MRRQRGFTYLFVLFFVAITAAGLAALGQAWSTAMQREKERELEFRGHEIARAIRSYRNSGVGQQSPTSLQDLLEDARTLPARHHLRRLYVDPFSGESDWELIPDPAQPGRFSAVRSKSDQVLLKQTTTDGQTVHAASAWVFGMQ
jgi:type II secretory pathway pseudopilin PulG